MRCRGLVDLPYATFADLGGDRIRAESGAGLETSYGFSQEDSSCHLSTLLSRHHRQVVILIVWRLVD